MKFDGKKYYKETMLSDKEYEKILNMYTQDLGVTTKIHMQDYETLDELKENVDNMVVLKLNNMWSNYYEFCVNKLNHN